MARYGMDYGRDFRPQGPGRGEGGGRGNWRGQQVGGMRSDGWGSDWDRFPGEEGWYGGGRGYDEGFRGGMGQGRQGGMRGGRQDFGGQGGGYGGRDMGYEDEGFRAGGYGGGGYGSGGMQGGGGRGDQDKQMRAAELMTEDPQVVTPDATLADVARQMRDMDVGIIPVVDSQESRRLRGVITDRDIAIRAVAEGKDGKAKVSECMTSDVETVNKNDRVESVLQIMQREQVRRVPVTDREGRLVGIIAQADLALDYSDLSHRKEHKVHDTIERISEPSQGGGRSSGRNRSAGGNRMAAGGREKEKGGS